MKSIMLINMPIDSFEELKGGNNKPGKICPEFGYLMIPANDIIGTQQKVKVEFFNCIRDKCAKWDVSHNRCGTIHVCLKKEEKETDATSKQSGVKP